MTALSINTESPGPEDLKALFDLQAKARWRLAASTAVERKEKLNRLFKGIQARREAICEAIRLDFGKHPHESELTEIAPTLEEISFAVSHLRGWMKPKRVSTPISLAGGSSMIRYEAKGQALILSPWNYPFNLAMCPFTAAVAAGNTVILRSSQKVAHTARLLHDMIADLFPKEEAAVVLGGHEVADQLLEMPFDHFFFTGSTNVGRRVMAAAAKHLASVTLELGGKSPALVDESADIPQAAERLAWGKFINAGQTCVAPDYVLAHSRIAEPLAEELKAAVDRFYGMGDEERLASESLASLIDARALARLEETLDGAVRAGARLVTGGSKDPGRRRLAPTILADVSPDSPIMRDEIFGPVLPILKYEGIEEAITLIRSKPKPLAMYVFSRNDEAIEKLLASTSAGGTTVNNTIMHLANPHLPFGGVGESGLGRYHGRFGFEAFSHARAIYRQNLPASAKLLYPPYGERSRKGLRMLRILTK